MAWRARRPLGLLLARPLWLGILRAALPFGCTSFVLAASGCLLPQPDTPPIPPMSQAGSRSAPAKAPAAQPDATADATAGAVAGDTAMANGAGLPPGDGDRAAQPAASTAPMAPGSEHAPDANFGTGAGTTAALAPSPKAASSPTPGRLDLTFVGAAVAEVWVVPVSGGAGAGGPVVEGRFRLDLPSGEYVIELEVAGQRLRTTKPVAVPAGGERSLTVTVSAEALTIAETVPLEDAAEAEGPSPSPVP